MYISYRRLMVLVFLVAVALCATAVLSGKARAEESKVEASAKTPPVPLRNPCRVEKKECPKGEESPSQAPSTRAAREEVVPCLITNTCGIRGDEAIDHTGVAHSEICDASFLFFLDKERALPKGCSML